MALKGFNCKKCEKPFFFFYVTPENIIADKAEIKKYQKRGYQFVSLDSDISKIENWCFGHKNK